MIAPWGMAWEHGGKRGGQGIGGCTAASTVRWNLLWWWLPLRRHWCVGGDVVLVTKCTKVGEEEEVFGTKNGQAGQVQC